MRLLQEELMMRIQAYMLPRLWNEERVTVAIAARVLLVIFEAVRRGRFSLR